MNALLRPLERLLMRNAVYETRLVKTYVNEPHRVRLLFWRGVGTFLLALALLMGMNFLPPGSPWFTVCSVSVGWLLGRAALRQFHRASAYRDGWLDGRLQMITSLKESCDRDMTPDEWLEGEFERDRSVMRWL